jgi:protein-S-isoprenylcysteine O-methyltransferase Ste14
MRLVDHFEALGTQLFRRRGTLPTLIMVPVVLAALADFGYPRGSHAADLGWEVACFLVSLLGLALRVVVSGTVPEGTSGRNTKQRADELNTTGVYSVVRHPLYLANFIIGMGVSLQVRVWYLPVIVGLLTWLYYERVIVAEEAFLEKRFGDRFRTWANAVPIAIPRWRGYTPSQLPFSLPAAVRREFYGFCMLIVVFFMLDILEDLVQERRLKIDPFWTSLVVVAVVGFFVLRTLKHRTNLLRRSDTGTS